MCSHMYVFSIKPLEVAKPLRNLRRCLEEAGDSLGPTEGRSKGGATAEGKTS